ncbi:ABC transporter substrate-binding protein [Streptomyces sp. NPDC057438]|uniref:ABC transporter substrate-binding protein n=1 Tax=Streptomyces sp. NPDC057438 TaxID=3346133 RepID=UPI00367A1361
MNNATIGAAVLGGYLLGRTKKAKLALGLGALLAGSQVRPGQLGKAVDAPFLGDLTRQIRTELTGAGKAAATSVLSSKADSLAGTLHDRTAGLRERAEGNGGQNEADADADADTDTDADAGAEDGDRDEADEENGPDEDHDDGHEDGQDDGQEDAQKDAQKEKAEADESEKGGEGRKRPAKRSGGGTAARRSGGRSTTQRGGSTTRKSAPRATATKKTAAASRSRSGSGSRSRRQDDG